MRRDVEQTLDRISRYLQNLAMRESRTGRLTIHHTASERAELNAAAKLAGKGTSRYVLEAALAQARGSVVRVRAIGQRELAAAGRHVTLKTAEEDGD